MRDLIKYFIKYPIAANVIMLLIIVFGSMGLFNLRKTFFPERSSKLISVQAVYPGASPLEIEQMVTLKIEDNLDGITGIKRITSKSLENTSNVTIEIENNANNQYVLQDIKNAIDRISSFPNQMESPSIFLMEDLNPAISFAINGEVSLRQLKVIAEKIEEELKALEGISKTQISGYPTEEIEISVRENDLKRFDISFNEIDFAIKNENIDITGGTIKTSQENYKIRSNNKNYKDSEIKEIVIKKINNRIVKIKDIAEVNRIWKDVSNRKYFNNIKGVVINVYNTNNEDISIVAGKTKAYLKNFNEINNDVKADIIQDSSIIIEQRIALLNKNGIGSYYTNPIFTSKLSGMGSYSNSNIFCRDVYTSIILWYHIKCYFFIWNDYCNWNTCR